MWSPRPIQLTRLLPQFLHLLHKSQLLFPTNHLLPFNQQPINNFKQPCFSFKNLLFHSLLASPTSSLSTHYQNPLLLCLAWCGAFLVFTSSLGSKVSILFPTPNRWQNGMIQWQILLRRSSSVSKKRSGVMLPKSTQLAFLLAAACMQCAMAGTVWWPQRAGRTSSRYSMRGCPSRSLTSSWWSTISTARKLSTCSTGALSSFREPGSSFTASMPWATNVPP